MDLAKYRNKLVGSSDERAVSPVIGVILMVAVTVILAAVIAAAVMGMGDSIGETSPTTDVSVSTNSDYMSGDDSNDSVNEMVYLSHTTGDTLDQEDISVIVRDDDGASLASLDPNGDSVDVDNGDLSAELDGDFDAGSTITVIYDGTTDADLDNGATITVQLIHTPSDTTISDSEIDLPE